MATNLQEMKQRAALALADLRSRGDQSDFDGEGETCLKGWERHNLPLTEFPVPGLILFGLRNLREMKPWGPGEKLAWGVSAYFGSVPFSVALEKFGLQLYVPVGTRDEMRRDLVLRLHTVAKLAERCLEDVAQDQIARGNVTLRNKLVQFDGAYRYFREKARLAYEKPRAEREVASRDAEGKPTAWGYSPWASEIEGGYLAAAMVDAYFSRLEHLLVLVLPFVAFDPSSGALDRFVNARWGEKWTGIFAGDASASKTYATLRQIKESVRNPGSHGGFLKDGASFYFHVPEVGALPAMLRKDPVEHPFVPFPREAFDRLVEAFDGADEFLARSIVGPGLQYAQSGLDVAFSADFRDASRAAAKSEKGLEAFIEYQVQLADMHANMDY